MKLRLVVITVERHMKFTKNIRLTNQNQNKIDRHQLAPSTKKLLFDFGIITCKVFISVNIPINEFNNIINREKNELFCFKNHFVKTIYRLVLKINENNSQ